MGQRQDILVGLERRGRHATSKRRDVPRLDVVPGHRHRSRYQRPRQASPGDHPGLVTTNWNNSAAVTYGECTGTLTVAATLASLTCTCHPTSRFIGRVTG